MKILSIDTSSKICSVSILEDTTVILEKHTNDEKTHSQNLMPLIDELFKDTNSTLDNIDLLACSQGPGSFTGIRIGIATIKAFADAKNDNVYYSLFSNNGTAYTQIGDFKSCSIHDILSDLSIYDDKLIFVGDGSVIHHDLIITLIKNPVFANSEQNLQTSISIGKSAYNKFTNGIYGDSNSLLPIYLKKSQAERNLAGEK